MRHTETNTQVWIQITLVKPGIKQPRFNGGWEITAKVKKKKKKLNKFLIGINFENHQELHVVQQKDVVWVAVYVCVCVCVDAPEWWGLCRRGGRSAPPWLIKDLSPSWRIVQHRFKIAPSDATAKLNRSCSCSDTMHSFTSPTKPLSLSSTEHLYYGHKSTPYLLRLVTRSSNSSCYCFALVRHWVPLTQFVLSVPSSIHPHTHTHTSHL